MEYGYMQKLTVEGDSYNVIRIGGDTLEELVGKRNMYIEQGFEEATEEEWLENGGTPDDTLVEEPTPDDSSEVVATDIYSDL